MKVNAKLRETEEKIKRVKEAKEKAETEKKAKMARKKQLVDLSQDDDQVRIALTSRQGRDSDIRAGEGRCIVGQNCSDIRAGGVDVSCHPGFNSSDLFKCCHLCWLRSDASVVVSREVDSGTEWAGLMRQHPVFITLC